MEFSVIAVMQDIGRKRQKPLLHLNRIYKKYGSSGRYALRAVNFKVYPNQVLALTGENGSGKSTLMKIAAGLLSADAGMVKFEGKQVDSPEKTLIPGHSDIVFLHQDTNLDKNISVEELLQRSVPGLKDSERKKRILYLMRTFEIEHLRKKRTDELSGGEKQRAGWARAFAKNAKLFLLDEPFSSIDFFTAGKLKELVFSMIREEKRAAIFVTHSPEEAGKYADETLLMEKGRLVKQGSANEVFVNS